MDCKHLSRPMTWRRSDSHWEQRDASWCVKTVTFIQQNRPTWIEPTPARLKSQPKTRKESKSFIRQAMDRAHKYFHTCTVEELWHGVHRNVLVYNLRNRKSDVCTWESRNEAFPRTSSSSSAFTWSAWLLLQKQTKGLLKKK